MSRGKQYSFLTKRLKYLYHLSNGMTSENEIVAAEIQETNFGEKVALQSPFEAKDFIKVLPWGEHEEEVEEAGSKAAVHAGQDLDGAAINAAEDYGFSPTLSTHRSWDSNALGIDEGAWTVDKDAFDEVADFLEFAGFDVSVADGVPL